MRSNLSIWATFVEITERRNLFVHRSGIVSSHYLKVCKENGINISNLKVNDQLDISLDYFNETHKCLFELATKLTHTIWRKLLKNDLKAADRNLIAISYELLCNRQFNLADILLEFACSQKKVSEQKVANIFTVNKALSFYLQGNKEKCQTVLNSQDWSASSSEFKLAKLVLNENFEEACQLMKKIGADGDVLKSQYMTWPLFTFIRNEEIFKKTYLDIFGEEYSRLELPSGPAKDYMISEIDKLNALLNEMSKENEIISNLKIENEEENDLSTEEIPYPEPEIDK